MDRRLESGFHEIDVEVEAGPRQVLREELRRGDLEWERGKAWAFEQAMGRSGTASRATRR